MVPSEWKEILKGPRCPNGEDLRIFLVNLSLCFESSSRTETIPEDHKMIVDLVRSKMERGLWSADDMTTGFWFPGKAVRLPGSLDLVSLAAGLEVEIQTSDFAYQVLIGIDNQSMSRNRPWKERLSNDGSASAFHSRGPPGGRFPPSAIFRTDSRGCASLWFFSRAVPPASFRQAFALARIAAGTGRR